MSLQQVLNGLAKRNLAGGLCSHFSKGLTAWLVFSWTSGRSLLRRTTTFFQLMIVQKIKLVFLEAGYSWKLWASIAHFSGLSYLFLYQTYVFEKVDLHTKRRKSTELTFFNDTISWIRYTKLILWCLVQRLPLPSLNLSTIKSRASLIWTQQKFWDGQLAQTSFSILWLACTSYSLLQLICNSSQKKTKGEIKSYDFSVFSMLEFLRFQRCSFLLNQLL